MTDEEIIAKGFKPLCAYPPADWDGGEVLHREGYETTAIDWEAVRYHGSVIGYHPKKPNKIVIPDEGAPQWAKDRWYEICMLDGFGHVGPHLIAMLEEEPIDEDLIEAREVVAYEDEQENGIGGIFAKLVREGQKDDSFVVKSALRAIKRGRELGKAGGV